MYGKENMNGTGSKMIQNCCEWKSGGQTYNYVHAIVRMNERKTSFSNPQKNQVLNQRFYQSPIL